MIAVSPRAFDHLIVAGLLATGLAGCGGEPGSAAPESAAATATTVVAAATATAAPPAALGRPAAVPAQANIFGAGSAHPPAPGGGGGGVLPTMLTLPAGSHRVVTVPAVTGRVNPIAGDTGDNGPGGDREGPTDVESLRGISGIAHRRNGMFLVGVFLARGKPATPAPPRLDFTKRGRSPSLAPRLGQTFLVGDGRGRAFEVPDRATRLYLGFADGYRYIGPPGWYANNAGKLAATVRLERRG